MCTNDFVSWCDRSTQTLHGTGLDWLCFHVAKLTKGDYTQLGRPRGLGVISISRGHNHETDEVRDEKWVIMGAPTWVR